MGWFVPRSRLGLFQKGKTPGVGAQSGKTCTAGGIDGSGAGTESLRYESKLAGHGSWGKVAKCLV
jgi:hypothetical protein